MFVILVYDVNEKRVQKVYNVCKKYLTWVQNSVFEGEITQAMYRIMMDELQSKINKKEDSILVYKFRTKKYYERETFGVTKPSSEDFIF